MRARRRKTRNSLVAQLKRLDLEQLPFVGRGEELKQLGLAVDQHNALLTVMGYSGVGKTALVKHFAQTLQDDKKGWLFLSGKFDQQASSRPYSAISIALKQLIDDYREEIQGSLISMDKEQVSLVLGVVPCLAEFFPAHHQNEQANALDINQGVFRSQRIREALVTLFQLISNHRNILIQLDDAHWADTASLDLVETLVATPNRRLTFILTLRSNEMNAAPMLSTLLKRHSSLTIEVRNLSLEDLNTMMIHLLERKREEDRETVLELSRIIHGKTSGNVFFSLQLVTWLQRKMLLHYSVETYRWEWDVNDIVVEAEISENVVDLVSARLRGLPYASLSAVMVGSCLGSRFDRRLVLKLLLANVLSGTPEDTVGEENEPDFDLLVKEGVLTCRGGSDTFRFAHDRTQQAAHALFATIEERERTHFLIGQFLLKCKDMALETAIASPDLQHLLATDQLNLGASSIVSQKLKVALLESNHEAAMIAIRKSAFVQAERFHRTAIELLPFELLWSEHYDLALLMHSTWAETLLTLGEFDEVERIANLVLSKARNPNDACRVVYSKMNYLNSMNRASTSFEFGYKNLKKMGMKLPRKPNKFHLIREFLQAKRFLKKMSFEALLEGDTCSQEDLERQRLVLLLADTAFSRNDSDMMLFLFLKVLNLAFVQGPSVCTANALVYYGVVLGAGGDVEGAYQVHYQVTALAKRFNSRAYYSRTFIVVHVFLRHLRHALQDSLDPLLLCYKEAMRAGEMMHACNSCSCYVQFYFVSGLCLTPLIQDVQNYREIFLERNDCEMIRCWMDCFGQAALNLTGGAEDPFQIDGRFLDRDTFLPKAITERNDVGLMAYWGMYVTVSYILNQHSEHVQISFDELFFSGRVSSELIQDTMIFTSPPVSMYFCLASMVLERKTGKRKYRRKRRYLIKIIKKYVSKGVPGVSHRLLLIDAVAMTMERNRTENQVKVAFDKAISTASRTGFMQDAAIGNERCGNYFEQQDDFGWTEHYLGRANQLFADWGAYAKVALMGVEYPILEQRTRELLIRQSSGLRSRQRFKSAETDQYDAGVAEMIFDSSSESSHD